MADRQAGHAPTTRSRGPAGGAPFGSALLRRLQEHAPNSTQFIGFLTLLVSGAILLFFTGITVTVSVLVLIFFTPLILLSSPIWIPAGTVLLVAGAGFLLVCAAGVATIAGASWTYKYLRGQHPPGYDRVDYARSRIADTATHVKDYAREYGGHLQRRVRDAAPGA